MIWTNSPRQVERPLRGLYRLIETAASRISRGQRVEAHPVLVVGKRSQAFTERDGLGRVPAVGIRMGGEQPGQAYHGSGQTGLQANGLFEMSQRFGEFSALLQNPGNIIVRFRVIGRDAQCLAIMLERALRIALPREERG